MSIACLKDVVKHSMLPFQVTMKERTITAKLFATKHFYSVT